MTALAAVLPATESERAILERARHAYEARGYKFLVNPARELLPPALKQHRPDALATRQGENVLIEVKSRRTRASEMLSSYTRNLLASEPGWRLDVVYSSTVDPLLIPTADIAAIHRQLGEVEALIEADHAAAAFVLSWSLLEAALNHVSGETTNKAREADQVVHSLALLGRLDRDAERTLRGLAGVRDRVAHGDLAASVSARDVDPVLDAVRGALAPE